MTNEEDQCFFCHKLHIATSSEKWRLPSGELVAIPICDTPYIIAETSRGEICICEECYINGNFGDWNRDDLAEIHYQFGLVYRNKGRVSESVDALHRGLQLKQTADMLAAIAYGYRTMNEFSLEIEFYQQALALDPSHFMARENLKIAKNRNTGE